MQVEEPDHLTTVITLLKERNATCAISSKPDPNINKHFSSFLKQIPPITTPEAMEKYSEDARTAAV